MTAVTAGEEMQSVVAVAGGGWPCRGTVRLRPKSQTTCSLPDVEEEK